MRELYRRNKDLLVTPLDVVLVAHPAITEAAWAEVRDSYLQAVGKIFERRRAR
jgi:RNase P protein component